MTLADWLRGDAASPTGPADPASNEKASSLFSPTDEKSPSTRSPSPRLRANSPTDSSSPNPWLDACLRLDPTNPVLVASITAATLIGGSKVWKRYGRRIRNVDSLKNEEMQGGRRLRGYVTSVGDADNFRFWHQPTLRPWAKPPTKRADLKDETLHVRLAGVDAPELAHFGNPAQPYAAEALDWLTRQLLGRKVRVELYRKDQYGRVVGMCYVRNFPWIRASNVSALMLKAGFATVYEQANAVHGGRLAEFQQLEAKAKKAKIGMWQQARDQRESPADFKKRMKKEAE